MSDPPTATEWIPLDTWCPGCLPDPPDALGSTLAYCMAHQPSMAGADDAQATRVDSVWNSGDATGENCRAIQALIPVYEGPPLCVCGHEDGDHWADVMGCAVRTCECEKFEVEE